MKNTAERFERAGAEELVRLQKSKKQVVRRTGKESRQEKRNYKPFQTLDTHKSITEDEC